jgi:hypothetical protein
MDWSLLGGGVVLGVAGTLAGVAVVTRSGWAALFAGLLVGGLLVVSEWRRW